MGKKSARRRKESGNSKSKAPPGRSAVETRQLEELQTEKEQLGERLAQEPSTTGDLAADAGTNELLKSMLARCMKLFNCRSGSILLFNPNTEELELAVAEGPMREALLGTRQPMGAGVAGTVAELQEGIFVEDIEKSEEFEKRDSERYETNSFACVPIVYHGELLGVLNLSDKESGESFGEADVGRVLAIAGGSAGTLRQSLQQEKLRSFNIELHRRLDAAIQRLQDANQELAELKNFNESILTSIALGLVAFDDKYHVTFYNKRACEVLRLGPPDDMDTSLWNLDINCDGMSWEEVLKTIVEEGKQINCPAAEYAVQAKDDGKPAGWMLSVSAAPLRDVRDRVAGGVVVIEDVTERVKMEKRLSASERHAVIGKLAARVAHELNNPLDGILRFINLSIALKDEDDQTRDYLVECKKGLERMVGIVSSLLEFSRSTYPIHHDTVLNDVIREAVRTLRHRADQQQIKVVFDLEDNLPQTKCGELVQVFLNLTKNAYDAMKQGGVFTIVTRREGDNQIKVSLSDSGCGIRQDIIHRIFDPFFTTKGPSEGTGLGLAICYDIVDKHGGKIVVESDEEKGTTFIITLPVE